MVSFAGAAQKTEAKTTRAAAAKPKPAARPRGVPAGAKQVEPGIWEVQDPGGKGKRYRETPWGVMPIAQDGEGAAAHALSGRSAKDDGAFGLRSAADSGIRVSEAGDLLRFEKDTPFGPRRWTKKKTELNDVERQVWEKASKKEAPSGEKRDQARAGKE